MTTVYIGGIYEWQAGASTAYYAGPDGAVAFRRSGYATDTGVFYLLRDHLGSSSVIVDGSGNVVKREFYYPFGGNRGSAFSDLTSKRLTGQYHEDGLPGGEGLSYYNARWYDAQLGRFVSADTIVPNPANPQTLNRYTYVVNSPHFHVDPTGHVYIPYEQMQHDPGPAAGSQNKIGARVSRTAYSYASSGSSYRSLPANVRERVGATEYRRMSTRAKLERFLPPVKRSLKRLIGPATQPIPLGLLGIPLNYLQRKTISLDAGFMYAPIGPAVRGSVSWSVDSEGTHAWSYSYGGGGSTPATSVGLTWTTTTAPTVRELQGVSLQSGGTVGVITGISAEGFVFPEADGKGNHYGISVGPKAIIPEGLPGSFHGTVTNTDIRATWNPIDWGIDFWLNVIYPCNSCSSPRK